MNNPENKNKNRNRFRHKNRRPNNNNPQSNLNSNNNNRPQFQSHEKLVKAYYVMIEKIQIARRKYFDDFHHQDPNRVLKLQKSFERSMDELRAWESKLSPKEAEIILKEKKPDHTYSTIQNLSPIGVNEIKSEEIKDPHLINSQNEAIKKYKQDREESVGTMDDYRSYKNIN